MFGGMDASKSKCEECDLVEHELFCVHCTAHYCEACSNKTHASQGGQGHAQISSEILSIKDGRILRLKAKEAVITRREALLNGVVDREISVHDKVGKTKLPVRPADSKALGLIKQEAENLHRSLQKLIAVAEDKVTQQLQISLAAQEQVERVARTLNRALGEVRDGIDHKREDFMNKILDLTAGEVTLFYKQLELVQRCIIMLSSAKTRHSSPRFVNEVIAFSNLVLDDPKIMMIPEGTVSLAPLADICDNLVLLVDAIGEVSVRYHKDDEFEAAMHLAKARDFSGAFELLQKTAKLGNVNAQVEVANFLLKGIGTDKNPQLAFQIVSDASSQPENASNGPLLVALSQMYLEGKGVDRNPIKALTILQMLAETDDKDALRFLAENFDDREVMSTSEHLSWVKRSVSAGNLSSKAKLASMYMSGSKGTGKDLTKAIELYRSAAMAGDSESCYEMALIHQQGKGTAQDMSKAMEWYQKACDYGNTRALFTLGYMYETGTTVDKSIRRAMELYRSAADLGDIASTVRVAYLYEHDHDECSKDMVEAGKWYKSAADQSEPFAQFKLGTFLEYGFGGALIDMEGALDLYQKAASGGNGHAQARIGLMYFDGLHGQPKDIMKGLVLLKKAATQKVGDALYRLGMAYLEATGVEEDLEIGQKYISEAASLGQKHATYVLKVSAQNGFYMSYRDVQKAFSST